MLEEKRLQSILNRCSLNHNLANLVIKEYYQDGCIDYSKNEIDLGKIKSIGEFSEYMSILMDIVKNIKIYDDQCGRLGFICEDSEEDRKFLLRQVIDGKFGIFDAENIFEELSNDQDYSNDSNDHYRILYYNIMEMDIRNIIVKLSKKINFIAMDNGPFYYEENLEEIYIKGYTFDKKRYTFRELAQLFHNETVLLLNSYDGDHYWLSKLRIEENEKELNIYYSMGAG